MSEPRMARLPCLPYIPRLFGDRIAPLSFELGGRAFVAEIRPVVKPRGLTPIERRAVVGRG